ncbi:hypothetical protein Rhopal_004817-T1 [Rhodotorula paludigena]|uniref:protein O-GlcNAc transferase n=1 Tax=Rhodotorula paludigena TaxID=86838 RepID=A0AAV5GMS3_9BASI|nr:hypothetical protein Rhopal_004817-T1 [Rhodotorula paludigena]
MTSPSAPPRSAPSGSDAPPPLAVPSNQAVASAPAPTAPTAPPAASTKSPALVRALSELEVAEPKQPTPPARSSPASNGSAHGDLASPPSSKRRRSSASTSTPISAPASSGTSPAAGVAGAQRRLTGGLVAGAGQLRGTPAPDQTFQTASQVASILSLPPPLLLQLARTDSPQAQKEIAEQEGVKGYLSSMAIPPPSPTTLVNSIAREGLTMTPATRDAAPGASGSTTSALAAGSSANGAPSSAAAHASTPSPAPSFRLPLSLPLAPFSPSSLDLPDSADGSGHPAIPVLLGQVFAPPPLTPGVLAPIPGMPGVGEALRGAASKEQGFEPVYASVEQWSYEVAKDQVFSSASSSSAAAPASTSAQRPGLSTSRSFNEREVTQLAQQMKAWALSEQDKQVDQRVVEAKSAAVVLAAQAASSGSGPDEHVDLSAYAEAYKRQLDALASGYFAQLHRDALQRLADEKVGEQDAPVAAIELYPRRSSTSPVPPIAATAPSPGSAAGAPGAHAPTDAVSALSSSQAPTLTSLTSLTSSRTQAEAMHVRASAAAAVAAQVMAAKDLARHAGERLASQGRDPRKVVEEVEELVEVQKGGKSRRGSAAAEGLGMVLGGGAGPGAVAGAAMRRSSTGGRSAGEAMAVEDVGKAPRLASPPLVPASASASGSGSPAGPTLHQQLQQARQAASPASLADLASLPPAGPPPSAAHSHAHPPHHHHQHHQHHHQHGHSQPVQPPSILSALTGGGGGTPDLAALATPEKRDYLLAYAHQLYSSDPQSHELLPLLHTLESMHGDHLPTLLLISCVYYTRGELESSLYYNKRLLTFDPSYVEAMSNIGTTLRAMGRWAEAESWWWKAIKLRPTYWDATENLLGVLCNPNSSATPAAVAAAGQPPPPTEPRYKEALALCNYVESQIYAQPASVSNPAVPTSIESFVNPLEAVPRPRCLPAVIPFNHVHRLQNLFYAKGNLRLALGDANGAQDEYEKAVETALSLPEWAKRVPTLQWPAEGCSVRDLLVAATVIGKILAAFAESGANPARTQLVSQMAQQLGVADERGGVPFERLFRTVRSGGDAYVAKLLEMGGGVLPTVLLEPSLLVQLPGMLFPETRHTLPAMMDPASLTENGAGGPAAIDPARKGVIQSTNQTTSTMLLTLAKILQDSLGPVSSAAKLTIGGIPASQSLLLPLYYVALALYPSPSTCNNLGILLSTLNATALIGSQDPTKPAVVLTGQQLALRYYEAGLKLDPRHPHLYTNLGSLLKDLGKLPEAVAMYKRAVEFNPTFDVALANLANAVKDTGQIQESIPYYRRAVQLNPHFPEAVCGLVNALGGVCDWKGRGGVGEEWLVDEQGQVQFVPAQNGQTVRQGYMAQISELVQRQLRDGSSYGVGVLRAYGDLDQWVELVSQALYNIPAAKAGDALQSWVTRFQFLLGAFDRRAHNVNEGGYLVRLIERLMRRIQRRWYLTAFGKTIYAAPGSTHHRIVPTQADVASYRRPPLPPSLPPIPVPTVLPFHCFTLPVTARETRLISHRTGLRISHSTLNQPWMPPIVYPPPRPPVDGKLNLGYVSSDLGNHPLSHLMQSVFGYHDLSRFNVFVYATSPSDKSPYRTKIEAESQHFLDVSRLSTQQIVDRIVQDEIHVLINLSGYTKGARNEVFAARPAPVQMSYMGFASTLSAGWCDYFIVDPIVCPPKLVSGNLWRWDAGFSRQLTKAAPMRPTDFEGDLDPEGASEAFVYTEKLIYLPHSYFVTDHKQAWREDETIGVIPGQAPLTSSLPPGPEAAWALEEHKRWQMRKQMFPSIRDDTIIFANWNQLYKIDPFIFRIWLSILKQHPNSILWLLRFPAPGEAHLKETAALWAGQDVADRVVFTDVANKNEHIHRGRIADLFLDTTECNAHTTAADILWSGTPILTYPRHEHKMCSRVAASIAVATGFGREMIVSSADEYERRALELATGLSYERVPPTPGAPPGSLEGVEQRRAVGELAELRKALFLSREQSPLFDTKRWVRNLEKGLVEAWERYVSGAEFEDDAAFAAGPTRQTATIWCADDRDGPNVEARHPYFQ